LTPSAQAPSSKQRSAEEITTNFTRLEGLTPKEGQNQKAPLREGKDTSFLKLNVDPWADVYLNGEFVGQTPMAKLLPVNQAVTNLRLVNSEFGVW